MATSRRRIRDSKRRHEAAKHFQQLVTTIYQYINVILRFDDPTFTIAPDGTGHLYVPSRAVFERLTPRTAPNGLIFVDGSFLVIKEIFRYEYANETDNEPRIVRAEFSYHYQSPQRKFYFRYDHHPEVGDLTTHPLYHLHVGCWHEDGEKFSGVPRFRAPEVMLEEVLTLIIRDFLTNAH